MTDLPEALSVAGRTALVTGGGTGIGRACALTLTARGAKVFVLGRTEASLLQTQSMAAPGSIQTVVADVRESEQVDDALQRILAEGPLDILVNNAGGQFISAAEQITPKGFRAVMRLNLDATWYLTTQAASLSMLANGYGKVACITMTPSRGMPGMTHSSASRAAVESLVRTWAAEWASRGVRTVAVAPGIVHTEAMERYGIDPAQGGNRRTRGSPANTPGSGGTRGFLRRTGRRLHHRNDPGGRRWSERIRTVTAAGLRKRRARRPPRFRRRPALLRE